MPFEYPVISADSHITEPPDCYTAHIDPAFRDQAPHMVTDDKRGDLFVVPGMKNPIAIGLVAAAGKAAEELTEAGVLFGDIHRSGWDATARVADQVRDGVSAEIIIPTSTTSGPASRPTTAGSPSTARRTRPVCWAPVRPPCAAST